MIALVFTQIVFAAEMPVEDGGTYPSGTHVVSAPLGVSLDIPKKWIGALPPGSPALVLGSESVPGMCLVTASRGVSRDDLVQALSGQQTIDGTMILSPTGRPTLGTDAISAIFEAETATGPFVAYATGVVGSNGTSVVTFATGPKENASLYEGLVQTVLDSVLFAAVPGAPKAHTPTGMMAARLGDKKLTGIHSAGGQSIKEELWLCADGRMSRNPETAGFDLRGFSPSSGGGWAGVWDVTETHLKVTDGVGSEVSYELLFTDGKLSMNGDRFFREDYRCP